MILSIITLTYGNRSECLRSCIDSVLLNTEGIIYEYIVVDNDSCPDTVRLLETYASEIREFVWIRNERNLGTSARNDALDIARGEFFAIVDDDVVITERDWFSKMKNYFANDVWAVGCTGTNFAGPSRWFGRSGLPAGAYCDFLTGYHCLFRNLRENGHPRYKFDPNYRSLREDSDLLLSARLDGWRARVCPCCCRHHSRRLWNPSFDSPDADTAYFTAKWTPMLESRRLQLEAENQIGRL